jgi:hypothetical protein
MPSALRNQRATAINALSTQSSLLQAKTAKGSKPTSSQTPNKRTAVAALDEADLKLMAQLQGHSLATVPSGSIESSLVSVQDVPSPMAAIDNRKLALINAVSASLIGSPKLDDKADKTRLTLLRLAEAVVHQDPEFLLKLALCTLYLLGLRCIAPYPPLANRYTAATQHSCHRQLSSRSVGIVTGLQAVLAQVLWHEHSTT